MWSSLLYVVSLCTLYASSTLAHSFFRMRTMGRVFQIMDHASIYLLIAGSYGPFTLVSLGDGTGRRVRLVFACFLPQKEGG